MPEYRTDDYSKLEALLGLKLFNCEQLKEPDRKSYHRFFKEREQLGKPDKLLAWYFRFIPGPVRDISRSVVNKIRLAALFILILSFLAGTGAAGVLFYYDGSAPINVLPLLAFFVVLPLFFLLLSFILPYTKTSFLSPLFSLIIEKTESTIKKYNHKKVQAIRENMNEAGLVYNEPVQILFRKTLQKSAVAYVSGALLWMLFNVTTTDLAFSWSSTLDISGDKIYSITSTMSSPWARILPSATVDYETVESTRFFRADRSDLSGSSSGRWWSFIFMSIVFYSLIPRTLAWLYYRWQFKRKIHTALTDSETGYALLNLSENHLFIETDNSVNYELPPEPDQAEPAGRTKKCTVLLWYLSGLNENEIAGKLNRDVISVYSIGGLSPAGEDHAIAREIARQSAQHDNSDIIIFVKYWESPNIRFEKLVKEIISHSPAATIRIIPLYDDPSQSNSSNDRNWRSRISSLNKETGKKRVFFEPGSKADINVLN